MRAVIYPSDVLFYTAWALVKWFVDPVTREKVQPMMYLSGVEQFIERQYIPKAMVRNSWYILSCIFLFPFTFHVWFPYREVMMNMNTTLTTLTIHLLLKKSSRTAQRGCLQRVSQGVLFFSIYEFLTVAITLYVHMNSPCLRELII